MLSVKSGFILGQRDRISRGAGFRGQACGKQCVTLQGSYRIHQMTFMGT